jgi:hypothetical protein
MHASGHTHTDMQKTKKQALLPVCEHVREEKPVERLDRLGLGELHRVHLHRHQLAAQRVDLRGGSLGFGFGFFCGVGIAQNHWCCTQWDETREAASNPTGVSNTDINEWGQ